MPQGAGHLASTVLAPLADASASASRTLGDVTVRAVTALGDAVAAASSSPTVSPTTSSSTQLVDTHGSTVAFAAQPAPPVEPSWQANMHAFVNRMHLSWQSPPDFSTLLTQLVQEQPLWLLGVSFMVLGTLSSACGMLLLKRATLGPGPVPPWYKNVWWWAGMMLIVVNASVLDIVAFAVTPLSLIAPFAGLTIVFSVCLVGVGCFGVREVPSTLTSISVGLIVFGVTIAATFGPHEDRALRPAEMQQILEARPGIYWLGNTGLLLVLLLGLVQKRYEEQLKRGLASPAGSLLAAIVGATYGGLTQLLFKTAATAVVSFVQGGGFPYPSAKAMAMQLSCAAFCALGQVVFLNVAIASSPVAYAVPAYQSALLLITLSFAGTLLDEFAHMDPLHFSLFNFGCGFVLLGIALNAVSLNKQARGKEAAVDLEGKGPPATAPAAERATWMPRSLRSAVRGQ